MKTQSDRIMEAIAAFDAGRIDEAEFKRRMHQLAWGSRCDDCRKPRNLDPTRGGCKCIRCES